MTTTEQRRELCAMARAARSAQAEARYARMCDELVRVLTITGETWSRLRCYRHVGAGSTQSRERLLGDARLEVVVEGVMARR